MAHAGEATAWVVVSNRMFATLAGGLAGGIAFGILMQVTGIVLMVAALFDRDTAVVGWGIHMAISLLFALIFSLVFRPWLQRPGPTIVLAVWYGWLWWILGGLIIMPAWLGMSEMIFAFNTTAWQSLVGHLLYGLLLGVAYAWVNYRLERPRPGRPREPTWL